MKGRRARRSACCCCRSRPCSPAAAGAEAPPRRPGRIRRPWRPPTRRCSPRAWFAPRAIGRRRSTRRSPSSWPPTIRAPSSSSGSTRRWPSSDAGLTYEDDIEPWLGEQAGVFFETFTEDADGAAVVATTDPQAARAGDREGGAADEEPERRRSYEGVDYLLDRGGTAAGAGRRLPRHRHRERLPRRGRRLEGPVPRRVRRLHRRSSTGRPMTGWASSTPTRGRSSTRSRSRVS